MIQFTESSESSRNADSEARRSTSFLEGFLLAVILVYLVLVLQFRSFLDPVIVLLTVPLGLTGVGALRFVTGTNLSIMATMGIIMMVGLVVAYSILLVDYRFSFNRRGDPQRERYRGVLRLRARIRDSAILSRHTAAVRERGRRWRSLQEQVAGQIDPIRQVEEQVRIRSARF